jgi:hypothetical protein
MKDFKLLTAASVLQLPRGLSLDALYVLQSKDQLVKPGIPESHVTVAIAFL